MAARGILIRAAGAALLLAVLWHFTPPEPGFRLCGFRWLTGRPCPFCGLTHALFALAKGHWGDAIRFNGLSPLAFAMLLALPWNCRLRGHLWTAGLAAFAVYGICRAVLPAIWPV
jgi:hypothetical protein